MGDWRNTGLVSGLMFLISSVSAQSTDELIGSNLTVEESLVQFVNAVITFEVNGTEDVLLYVVAPLLGFYYVILNFTTMAYENFQDEIDRPSWSNTDEEIPRGMRGFAMMTSVITVLFLGSAGAALLLSASLISFVLAIFMFFGLFETDEDQDNTDNTGNTQNGGGAQQNTQQGNGGGGLADALNAGANLLGTANNTLNNLNQQNQQQQANQLQESLNYFMNDMVSEIERVSNGHSNVENLINQLNNELTDHTDFDPDTFKNTLQRAQKVEELATGIRNSIAADLNADPNPNYNSSNLKTFLTSNIDRDLKKEVSGLEGQLERILSSAPSSPPKDAFNDLLEELRYVVAVAHFMHYSPFSMAEISSDRSKAQKVVDIADSMNKIQSRPDNVDKVQIKAGWLDTRSSIPANLIEESEKLCRKEMKISETEIKSIKGLIAEDEDLHGSLKYIDRNLSNYRNLPSSFENNANFAKNKIKDIDTILASLESKVATQHEFRSQIYEKLEELKGKI